MWVYADQAHNYKCDDNGKVDGVSPSWNCNLWSGFGTKYAYIHTGLHDYAINGTTLAISKQGSGLNEIINPCLQKFMQTKDYFEIC